MMLDSGARPHISLTVFDGDVPEKLRARQPQGLSSFELSFTAFGAFPNNSGVFYLAPGPSGALLQTYLDWYSSCTEEHEAIWEKYTPADWTPHCTTILFISVSWLPTFWA
jgi:2'-5' RNA ligase